MDFLFRIDLPESALHEIPFGNFLLFRSLSYPINVHGHF